MKDFLHDVLAVVFVAALVVLAVGLWGCERDSTIGVVKTPAGEACKGHKFLASATAKSAAVNVSTGGELHAIGFHDDGGGRYALKRGALGLTTASAQRLACGTEAACEGLSGECLLMTWPVSPAPSDGCLASLQGRHCVSVSGGSP